MKEKNMQFWNGVCRTNPAETKTVEYPFKHTAIGAMFQIKHATEQWGMFGDSWGVKDEKYTAIHLDTEEKGFLLYNAVLFYPGASGECEIPIHADINFYNKTKNGYKVENDLSKKVATDALTKGLSKLGFNADVFEGLFDDNKYIQRMIKEFSKPEEKQKGDISGALKAIGAVTKKEELEKIKALVNQRAWTDEEMIRLLECIKAMEATL